MHVADYAGVGVGVQGVDAGYVAGVGVCGGARAGAGVDDYGEGDGRVGAEGVEEGRPVRRGVAGVDVEGEEDGGGCC